MPFGFGSFNVVFQATDFSVAFPSATHKLDPFIRHFILYLHHGGHALNNTYVPCLRNIWSKGEMVDPETYYYKSELIVQFAVNLDS